MAKHYDLGKEGEQLAVTYLIEKGCKILKQNYHFQKAEIDIIAQKADTLICVEVKTRSTDYFGNPQDFIDSKKIKLLVKAMDNYVIANDLDVEVRFDIIAIIKQDNQTKIAHIEDAFLYF
ncbi:MAG TPA: YraN family protein [Flavobacteriia bacterium]|nr:YraN family protein [Flavobacteriia bacterium]